VETWFIEYCFQILCAHMIVPYVRHIGGVVSVSLCLNSKDLGVVSVYATVAVPSTITHKRRDCMWSYKHMHINAKAHTLF